MRYEESNYKYKYLGMTLLIMVIIRLTEVVLSRRRFNIMQMLETIDA